MLEKHVDTMMSEKSGVERKREQGREKEGVSKDRERKKRRENKRREEEMGEREGERGGEGGRQGDVSSWYSLTLNSCLKEFFPSLL